MHLPVRPPRSGRTPFHREYLQDQPQNYGRNQLDVTGAPLSEGETGSLSYYEPWGDVVMFYAPCTPNSSLYELGSAISGTEHIENLSGTITVSAVKE